MKRMCLAAALVLALAASPALAKDDQPTNDRLVPVSYSDLDVNQTDDARALLSRLRYAATRACEVSVVARPGPALRRAIEECRTAALDEAVQSANAPEVSRLHDEQRR